MAETLTDFAARAALQLGTESIVGGGFRATLTPCALHTSYLPQVQLRSHDTIAGPVAETAQSARARLAESLRGLWVTSDPSSPRNMYSFQAPSDLEG